MNGLKREGMSWVLLLLKVLSTKLKKGLHFLCLSDPILDVFSDLKALSEFHYGIRTTVVVSIS